MLRTRSKSNVFYGERRGPSPFSSTSAPMALRRLIILIIFILGFFMFLTNLFSSSSSQKDSESSGSSLNQGDENNFEEGPILPPRDKTLKKEKSPTSHAKENNKARENSAKFGPAQPRGDYNYDKIAIALKTGKDVARTRVPIQLATFMKDIKNTIVIAEAPNVTVGVYDVVDVYSPAKMMYDAAKKEELDRSKRKAIFEEHKKEQDVNRKADIDKGEVEEEQEDEEHNEKKSTKKIVKRDKNTDAVVPDNSSQGWKLDAHKNLPAFKILYNKFPEADWYMMIDDDTFVFFDNFLDRMKQYDPEVPHYLGQPNYFVGCDGVKKFGDGPNFAHGGTGIVISRGAMKKMMTIIDKCIVKYKDCWAGDIRVALCMRDIDIFVVGPGDFHGDPPNQHFGWSEDPCGTPITFHHLLIDQTQLLYDVLKETPPGKKVNYGAVFNKMLPLKDVEILNGIDMPGSDFSHVQAPDYKSCQDLCKENKKCKSWSFMTSDKVCWLKKGIPSRKENKNAISGIFPERYQCAS